MPTLNRQPLNAHYEPRRVAASGAGSRLRGHTTQPRRALSRSTALGREKVREERCGLRPRAGEPRQTQGQRVRPRELQRQGHASKVSVRVLQGPGQSTAGEGRTRTPGCLREAAQPRELGHVQGGGTEHGRQRGHGGGHAGRGREVTPGLACTVVRAPGDSARPRSWGSPEHASHLSSEVKGKSRTPVFHPEPQIHAHHPRLRARGEFRRSTPKALP